MKPAVVIKPATPVETIVDVLPLVHHVLIMSVEPGFGGQHFMPASLDKLRHLVELRSQLGLSYRIEVDGGITDETVASVVEAGADLLVAGTAVFEGGHAERNGRELLRLARLAAG